MRLKKNIGILFLFLMLFGCSNDRDTDVVVDFTETIPTDIPVNRSKRPVLRVAVSAMISPGDTHDYYRRIFSYLSNKMNMELEFIQRKTYAEVNDMLEGGKLDVAFICAGPYVRAMQRNQLTAVAAPVVEGKHTYQSYLIVGANSPYETLADLRGKKFAFTDPDSNTGHLVPVAWLFDIGTRPEDFFVETIFSYSHDNSIMAVAKGLVDAASVDSIVWDFYKAKYPDLASKTRIIRKSASFGVPPIVASSTLSSETRQKIAGILLKMHEKPEGRDILSGLRIDRFVHPNNSWYKSLDDLLQHVAKHMEAAS